MNTALAYFNPLGSIVAGLQAGDKWVWDDQKNEQAAQEAAAKLRKMEQDYSYAQESNPLSLQSKQFANQLTGLTMQNMADRVPLNQATNQAQLNNLNGTQEYMGLVGTEDQRIAQALQSQNPIVQQMGNQARKARLVERYKAAVAIGNNADALAIAEELYNLDPSYLQNIPHPQQSQILGQGLPVYLGGQQTRNDANTFKAAGLDLKAVGKPTETTQEAAQRMAHETASKSEVANPGSYRAVFATVLNQLGANPSGAVLPSTVGSAPAGLPANVANTSPAPRNSAIVGIPPMLAAPVAVNPLAGLPPPVQQAYPVLPSTAPQAQSLSQINTALYAQAVKQSEQSGLKSRGEVLNTTNNIFERLKAQSKEYQDAEAAQAAIQKTEYLRLLESRQRQYR